MTSSSPFVVGDRVRVLHPFDVAFPDIYAIDEVKPDGTCVICGDRDFVPDYLERVE